MNSEEIIGAIGTNYLQGGVSMVWVSNKFCLLDNLEPRPGEEGFSGVLPKLRFPLKVRLTVCVFCREDRFAYSAEELFGFSWEYHRDFRRSDFGERLCRGGE